jgi:hypothetical protein
MEIPSKQLPKLLNPLRERNGEPVGLARRPHQANPYVEVLSPKSEARDMIKSVNAT